MSDNKRFMFEMANNGDSNNKVTQDSANNRQESLWGGVWEQSRDDIQPSSWDSWCWCAP
ncbi:hypothetical protein AERO9A_420037 [Aeromonas salmonicida]|nr:hypothetical protein AERO9A_420037 [Aeromonas salmonicida]